ncbi:hypothetical protein JYU02_00495, partial [bacterium AH-315-P15]|nr:hypothetical protein [bacterium AH-315-P15]
MLTRVDRVQLAVPDAQVTAAQWADVLGAEPAGQDKIACLGAKRTSYRIGAGWVEFLEPDGAGAVADAIAKRGGPHLFAGGAACNDVEGLLAHLKGVGAEPTMEGGQIFLDPANTGPGTPRTVISAEETLDPVGDIDWFYEITLLVRDEEKASERYAKLFRLNPEHFVSISSDAYGYNGILTLFHPDLLGRFEVITPTDLSKTMGRYFSKFGEEFYMGYAESAKVLEIEERVKERGLSHTVTPEDKPDGRPSDTLFLHPATLGGMML